MLSIKDIVQTNIPKYYKDEPDGFVEGMIVEMRLCADEHTIEYKVKHDYPVRLWFFEENLTKL